MISLLMIKYICKVSSGNNFANINHLTLISTDIVGLAYTTSTSLVDNIGLYFLFKHELNLSINV